MTFFFQVTSLLVQTAAFVKNRAPGPESSRFASWSSAARSLLPKTPSSRVLPETTTTRAADTSVLSASNLSDPTIEFANLTEDGLAIDLIVNR